MIFPATVDYIGEQQWQLFQQLTSCQLPEIFYILKRQQGNGKLFQI